MPIVDVILAVGLGGWLFGGGDGGWFVARLVMVQRCGGIAGGRGKAVRGGCRRQGGFGPFGGGVPRFGSFNFKVGTNPSRRRLDFGSHQPSRFRLASIKFGNAKHGLESSLG